MVDISDRDEKTYVFNGTLKFLTSHVTWSRTGYRGPRMYDKLGNLVCHPVTYEKAHKIAKPQRHADTGSPVSEVPFKVPGFMFGHSGYSRQQIQDDVSRKIWGDLANTNALLPLMMIERQKTLDMVTEKVLGLVKIKRSFLKELRRHYKGNDNKIVHQKWLEYRYGWLPTIMDINTLANKPLGLPGTLVTAYKGRSYDVQFRELDTTYNQNGRMKASSSVLALPKNPFMKTASQYGIANPSLVAWELLPYSFVVDWVFDFGGYFEHLGAVTGLDIFGATNSWEHTFHQESFTKSRPGLTSCYGSWKGKNGQRSLGLLPYPNPFIPSNGMNLLRFFDAVSLLRSLFKR